MEILVEGVKISLDEKKKQRVKISYKGDPISVARIRNKLRTEGCGLYGNSIDIDLEFSGDFIAAIQQCYGIEFKEFGYIPSIPKGATP